MNFCHYCNEEIGIDALYCQYCGKEIDILKNNTFLHQDRYKIIKSIAAGGMASIYLAKDLHLGEMPCVIKVMLDDFKGDNERDYIIKKFKEEAIILGKLRHPGLPVVQNYFVEENRYILVMDYIEGETLEEILNRSLKEDSFLSQKLIFDWGIQICEILSFLHNYSPPIIHRDIKLANIMKKKDGKIILLDFGIASIFKKQKTSTQVGTAGYAAPEQYMGEACPQSDLYSLGVVLHSLLTGHSPLSKGIEHIFKFEPLNLFRNDLLPELQDIISKATEKKVKKRYNSAEELKDCLIEMKRKIINREFFETSGMVSPSSENKAPADLYNPGIKKNIPDNMEAVRNNLWNELEKHLILTTGSVSIPTLEFSLKKCGYTKETLPLNKLDRVMEFFISIVRPDEETLISIEKKIKEIKNVYPDKNSYTTIELPGNLEKEDYDELEKYLVSITGSIGKPFLKACMEKLGYGKENLPVESLPEIVELFSSNFTFSEEVKINLHKKIEEIKNSISERKTLFKSEHNRELDKEDMDEFEEYLVFLLGPVAKEVLHKSIKKTGYKRHCFPGDKLESLIEIFSCNFNLTEEMISNIFLKINLLKNNRIKIKNMEKQEKKPLMETIFKKIWQEK